MQVVLGQFNHVQMVSWDGRRMVGELLVLAGR